MKKNIGIIILSIAISCSAGTASGDGVSINKLASEQIPFNDLRDPVNDTLYNALDGDSGSSSLFSDMEIRFSIPVAIDELKIINGKGREFREFGRLRDLEITLYTTGMQSVKKKTGTAKKKSSGVKSRDKRKSSSGTEEQKDLKNKTDEKIPEKNEQKNDNNDKKSSGGLTAVNHPVINFPVIGSLNEVLADEPVKLSNGGADSRDIKTDGFKGDIRDADKSGDKTDPSEKKITPDQKEKKPVKNKAGAESSGQKEIKADKKKNKVKKSTGNSSLKKAEVSEKGKSAGVKKTESVEKKQDESVQNKKNSPVIIDALPFKKMEGINTVENDSEGRVIVNISLKDIPSEQSIKLDAVYSITGIEIRKRDEYFYPGTLSQLPYLSEISFVNKGKRVAIQDMEPLKKEYEERFVQALRHSISGTVYSASENNREVTRILFTKEGKIEIRDRYKCFKKGEPDCTSVFMPDMWMIRAGKLYMRYAGEWLPWKYEMEYTPDLMSGAEAESDVRQWLKLYYKNKTGFSEDFLYLEKSKNQVWSWD